MQVRVLYFGVLKDLFHAESEDLEMPVGSTVGSLLKSFQERAPERGGLWSSLAVAVNQEYAKKDCALREGDHVALLPPVSGGGGESQRQSQGSSRSSG